MNNDDLNKEELSKEEASDEIIEEPENCEEEEGSDDEKLKDKKSEKDENEFLNNKMLRLQADFINYKNRVAKEKNTTYSNAVADVIKDLLPILDNFERAIETTNTSDKSMLDGVKMIYNQFYETLEKKGLKEIEALNKNFDPNLHYSVAFDSESNCDQDIIVEVFQKGYTINDKVIRPSMVKISK